MARPSWSSTGRAACTSAWLRFLDARAPLRAAPTSKRDRCCGLLAGARQRCHERSIQGVEPARAEPAAAALVQHGAARLRDLLQARSVQAAEVGRASCWQWRDGCAGAIVSF